MEESPPIPLKVVDTSFLDEEVEKKQVNSVNIVEKNIAIMSDASQLLYEAIMNNTPECLEKAYLFGGVGDQKTMPYPERETN